MTKPVDVEQTEHEKTNQNWCAVATGLQVKVVVQAAEIKRLRDALESLADDEWWDMETPSTAADFARAALKEQDND